MRHWLRRYLRYLYLYHFLYRAPECTVHWLPGRRPPAWAYSAGFRGRRSLSRLACRYGTDKWGYHWYTAHYQRRLAAFRRKRFTLLEIGIGGYADSGRGGESLRMWRAFFPRAQVVGLDLEEKSFVDGRGIATFQGSQSDEGVLQEIISVWGAPTIVIDDGSHRPSDVIATFEYLFPRMPNGGVYIVEDLQTSYWAAWGGDPNPYSDQSAVEWFRKLVHGLNFEEFEDIDAQSQPPRFADSILSIEFLHNLVIITKGRNVESD